MQKQLILKCLALLFVGLALMIPLSMIESTIFERNMFRKEAVQKVAANSAGSQTLIGPMLVIPVEEDVEEPREASADAAEADASGKKRVARHVKVTYKRNVILYPQHMNLDGALTVTKRAYGLHEVAVFEMRGVLGGYFDPPAEGDLPVARANGTVRWGKPRLVVGLSDTRGIVTEPKIVLGDEALKAARGTGLDAMGSGFQANVDFSVPGMTRRLPFRIELRLAGTEAFGVIPLAGQTTVGLTSNWKNPSFGGGFLPVQREVSDTGFNAHWSVSALAANVQEDLMAQSAKRVAGQPVPGSVEDMNSFRVNLIDPVDIYHQSVRAAKYGVLFIVLTFAAFFMFESVRNLPIHPIQYGLVGLALALFFLLLLSLSEHVTFAVAYAVSSLACVGLISIYLAAVLKGRWRAVGFGVGLGALYGYLYGVLLSEQNALMLGAILLFLVLAALMLATRKVDWYRLNVAREG